MQLLEYVEVPDGNIWYPDQEDNGRSFVEGGIYGKYENPWEDYRYALLNSPLKGDDLLPQYNHPLFELPDPSVSDEVEWLLVSPLLKYDYDLNDFELDDPRTWESSLHAEPVKVRKTRIQHEIEGVDDAKYGSSAYWVGDEGVKTKVSVQNPFADKFSPKPESERTEDQRRKDNLALATEPNLNYGFSEGSGNLSLKSGFELDWIESSTQNKRKDILSLSTLSELTESKVKPSAHFHSLTTDSFGLLVDVRTGGLKRDLSNAFANEPDWEGIDFNSENWSKDFIDYIYQQRIFYQKSVPMDDNAMENDWRVGSDQPLLEEMTMLAGPRWSTMGCFHNLYLLSSYGDILPDNFPRIVGDNNIIFNHLRASGVTPRSPGGDDLIEGSNIITRFNYFENTSTRPEPKNHPIQPVLVEFKYSHMPLYKENRIGLEAYPSLAFWNPYNVPITMKEIYIEIPMNTNLVYGDPILYDLYRKWYMYIRDLDEYQSFYNSTNPPDMRPVAPNDDINGNLKRDPVKDGLLEVVEKDPFYPTRYWFSENFALNIYQPKPWS